MVKKIFEIKENRVSVINIVLAVLSYVSIFIGVILIIVIWGFEIAVQGPTDVATVVLDIVFLIGSPACIIIRNLKLKNARKLIWHTFLEYVIAFASIVVLMMLYGVIHVLTSI